MNIGIIADLHFGVHNNDEKYLAFQKHWFETELRSVLEQNGCGAAVFLGDIFHNRTALNPLILKKVRKLFRDFAKKFDTHIVVGNHDIYYRDSTDVHSLETLGDQGCNIYTDFSEKKIGNRTCLFTPWIFKKNLERFESLLANNKYDICFGHMEINGFHKNTGLVESTGLAQDTFENCTKVYSGHFHLRDMKAKIKYIGTPYELDWGDYKSEKGIMILDLDTMTETICNSTSTPIHIKLKTKDISVDKLTKELVSNNFIDLEFEEGISETDRINYQEKIGALNPIDFFQSEEKLHSFDMKEDKELEANIKDVQGSLIEYMKLIGIPEGLSIDVAIEKTREIYDKSLAK